MLTVLPKQPDFYLTAPSSANHREYHGNIIIYTSSNNIDYTFFYLAAKTARSAKSLRNNADGSG